MRLSHNLSEFVFEEAFGCYSFWLCKKSNLPKLDMDYFVKVCKYKCAKDGLNMEGHN